MNDAAQIRAALARVGARMRLSALVAHAVVALPIALAVQAALVVLVRLQWIAGTTFVAASAILVLTLVAYLMRRARPLSALVAAHEADVALAAHDRLTSALVFVEQGDTSALHLAAISDGARVAAALDATQVVAIVLPRSAVVTPLASLLIALALFVHPFAKLQPPTLPQQPRFVVEPDALRAERLAVKRLANDAQGKDPELAALAQKLDALLAAVDQQKLTRAQAFAQLAQIEASQKQPLAPPLKPSEELKPALKTLSTNKQTEKLAEALKKDDLAAAKAELEKLAQKAEERAAEDPKEQTKEEKDAQQELQRALDKAGKALQEEQKKQEAARDKQIEQLEEEQRQLKKKQEQHPDDQETERQLKRNQRELERLEREKQAQAEQRRQLQRLSREMQDAAQQMRQKMTPEAMKRAAEELGKMEDEIRKLGGSGGQGQMQIAEIKEVLRRAGHQQGQGEGKDGQGKGGLGHSGNNGKDGPDGKNGRGQKLRQFESRADGKGDTILLDPEHPGSGSTLLMPMPGEGEPGSGDGKDPGGGKDPGDDKGNNGDGIGDEHDPNMLGDKTKLGAANKMLHAKGQVGAGPSRSQTILGASEKGFSSRDYHRVYDDYHSVVEDVMSQENVPPGYRYYVKRYFQLIRPRE